MGSIAPPMGLLLQMLANRPFWVAHPGLVVFWFDIVGEIKQIHSVVGQILKVTEMTNVFGEVAQSRVVPSSVVSSPKKNGSGSNPDGSEVVGCVVATCLAENLR